MKQLARISAVSVLITYLHLVFGGIVRITGSGMGCGDNWPRCLGRWFPPLDNPIVTIEWTHRLLALLVISSVSLLVLAARVHHREPGVSGKGGVLRPAALGLVLVLCTALLGMVTVRLGNATFATVAHWTLAQSLLGVLLVAAVRAGSMGGTLVREQRGSERTVRSIGSAAALAFLVVVMGGVVAKYPGASYACPGFPLCGSTPAGIAAGAPHIQLTHRVLAYLLFFHVIFIALAVRRRAGEAPVVKRAMTIAAGLVILQVILGASMVLGGLPQTIRVQHQAVGVAVWLTTFLATYLARRAATGTPPGAAEA